MPNPVGVIGWSDVEVKFNALEALIKQYAAGTVGGPSDGAKPAAAVTVRQDVPAPSWLAGVQKDLGAAWATGPKAGEMLAQDAKGVWSFAPAADATSVTMGMGALLGPVERPMNGVWHKLPLGSIFLGGGSAMLLGLAIDDLYPHTGTGASAVLNNTNLAIKGGLAVALTMFGTKIFSSTGALMAAAVFGLQVVADLGHKQVDSIVAWLVKTWNKITGRATVAQNNKFADSPSMYQPVYAPTIPAEWPDPTYRGASNGTSLGAFD